MDTRNKIVGRDSLPGGEAMFVSGYFDPMVAAHAAQLAELKRKAAVLVVVIVDPEKPVLPARARAELVAGLECVDFVVLGGDASVHLEKEHEQLFHSLVEHVARRNQP